MAARDAPVEGSIANGARDAHVEGTALSGAH